MRKLKPLRCALIAVALLSACTLAAAFSTIGYMGYRGAQPSPNPSGKDDANPGEFPDVDWAYWMQVNPDIIAWITIPETAVNLPIVQAAPQDPDFYLTHDVYGESNFTGCPYLDADCITAGGLLQCPNSVIYGHNMGWSRDMFGDLACYADKSWGEKHRVIFLQTPDLQVRLKVQALAIVPGWNATRRIEFADGADFASWWNACFAESDVRYEPKPLARRNLVTLCTCSYSHWDNERTLVYCLAA